MTHKAFTTLCKWTAMILQLKLNNSDSQIFYWAQCQKFFMKFAFARLMLILGDKKSRILDCKEILLRRSKKRDASHTKVTRGLIYK
uniref:Uncharacterized protein n=1 Tax=Romanomermis culicivorax TaxID=13658 RepID=A0A915ITN7_ROMCU